MNCPSCSTVLQLAERQGVEIDYCPSCRGVWLDRGELDKIVERSLTYAPAAPQGMPQREGGWPQQPRPDGYDGGYGRHGSHDDHDDDHRRGYPYDGRQKKRREGFLGQLFDF